MSPDYGGTYTAQKLFTKAIDCYFVDLDIPGYSSLSEADYTIKGSLNPFYAYFKSSSNTFFDFIPSRVKKKTQGVIIHGLFLAHFSYGIQLSKQLNVPLYVVPHGASHPYVFSRKGNNFIKLIVKYVFLLSLGSIAFSRAKAIIFTSESELKSSVIATSASKGKVCPLSVDIPDICRDNYLLNRESIRSSIRKKLGFSNQDKVLLYFGRITHLKRILETVQAFDKVKPKGWKLLVIGSCDSKESGLLNELESISIKNHDLKLLPPFFGDDKWKYVLSSDLFVLFSHRENFGFTVVECGVLEIPVYISKDVDIYPSFLSDSLPKMVFDIKSTHDIEDAISLLDNLTHEDLAVMGKFCKEKILNEFNIVSFRSHLHKALNLYHF